MVGLWSPVTMRTSAKHHHVPGWRGRAKESDLVGHLLAWYDIHGRDLAWRRRDGGRPDPYVVWLSEIMLQQTTVATVRGRFAEFIGRWPDVAALAAADLDQVLTAWAGLGYYARARNLHRCARIVVGELGGRFPDSEAALRALPGIGPYTAAAIAAIAFGRRSIVIDGNVERVLARLGAIEASMPAAKPLVHRLAERLAPHDRPGDYAQALMDLGATICTPTAPACPSCPWKQACIAHARGSPESYPERSKNAPRPRRFGVAFWVTDGSGRVGLRRRALEGLLGGMMEFPGTPWREQPWRREEARAFAPVAGDWRWPEAGVRHVFTHFSLELQVAIATDGAVDFAEAIWLAPERLGEVALPTLMRKVARVAMATAS